MILIYPRDWLIWSSVKFYHLVFRVLYLFIYLFEPFYMTNSNSHLWVTSRNTDVGRMSARTYLEDLSEDDRTLNTNPEPSKWKSNNILYQLSLGRDNISSLCSFLRDDSVTHYIIPSIHWYVCMWLYHSYIKECLYSPHQVCTTVSSLRNTERMAYFAIFWMINCRFFFC